jgi:hypothetical protein
MNYIKKIKSIGFKKAPNIAITNPSTVGFKKFLKIVLLEHISNHSDIVYPRCTSTDIERVQTYFCKVNKDIGIFLILIKEEFTIVVDKNKEISIPISSKKLNDNFWKEILSSLDKDIQREFILKDIFSFR